MIIQFFPAAKLFNGLPCSFSLHYFAKETLFQTNFVSRIQDLKKLKIFHKKFPYEVVYAFFGGYKFVGALFEILCDPKIPKGSLFNFRRKLLPGETLCKFRQIFPPKDLVYIGSKIFVTPLIS